MQCIFLFYSTASLIDELVPGQMITGTGADIIFRIPVMRQMMAWIGTMPAKRKNITKTFEKGI
jgi:1-acyl-sn-glycerol-3-phosphate acyltransferase